MNIGGDVQVDEDERVTDAVVAIGGSVDVRGRVEDDVVAVLGNVRLGPHAVVTGSVTSVGGRIEQERGAEVRGEVNEVTLNHRPWRYASRAVAARGWVATCSRAGSACSERSCGSRWWRC